MTQLVQSDPTVEDHAELPTPDSASPDNTNAGPVEAGTDDATAQFFERAMRDAGGTLSILIAAVGDRLGLFEAMAGGPAGAAELADRAQISERFALEWLRAMAATGYLTYEDGQFVLPTALVPVLAAENSPITLSGILGWVLAMAPHLDAVVDGMRSGRGVSMGTFGPGLAAAMARFSAPLYDNILVPQWISAAPDLQARLADGVEVADVGCGGGRAVLALAKAFPRSRFTGYDSSADQIACARAAASAAQLGDRVRFELTDARIGLPTRYDVITTFDVLHDSGDPAALLASLRSSVRDDGYYLCVEPRTAGSLEGNTNPVGAILYAISVLFCLQVAVADGGPGLGALGLPETLLKDMCRTAGFRSVEELPIDDPMNSLYLVRP